MLLQHCATVSTMSQHGFLTWRSMSSSFHSKAGQQLVFKMLYHLLLILSTRQDSCTHAKGTEQWTSVSFHPKFQEKKLFYTEHAARWLQFHWCGCNDSTEDVVMWQKRNTFCRWQGHETGYIRGWKWKGTMKFIQCKACNGNKDSHDFIVCAHRKEWVKCRPSDGRTVYIFSEVTVRAYTHLYVLW